MDYNPADLVDYAVQQEFDKLNTAFSQLADQRVQNALAKTKERIGAYYSTGKQPSGE
jgi:hypothetical protein